MWVTGSGLVPAPALYWPHVLPAPSPWQRPQQEWDYHPASARRRDHWLEEMETCISIALGKRPISHSGFDLQASSPSCMARWAGHSPQPILGCQDHTSLISDRLICMMSFWVLGIEPS